MQSAIYSGQVRHRRHEPTPHEFSYGLFMLYLDLAEVPELFDDFWLWSARRSAPARFDSREYLQSARPAATVPASVKVKAAKGPAADTIASEPPIETRSKSGTPTKSQSNSQILSLDRAVRSLVLLETGLPACGPIRLLTHLRYFGYCFNPVSFYYCFDATGEQVETIVAEITNTPWKERHAYVLPVRRPATARPTVELGSGSRERNDVMRFRFAKRFHVSPFMPMNLEYDWRMGLPGERLQVHMENWQAGGRVFDANLALRREEISSASLARALLSFPLMTCKVSAAIHWQALKLWFKGVPVFTNPKAIKPKGLEPEHS